jgi:polyribonucleotide nucleotidyltransferase
VVKAGDQIEVEITDIDRQGRISLTPVSWLARQVAQGKTLEEARALANQASGGGDRGPRRDGRDRGRGDRGRSARPRERERAPRPSGDA